MPLAELSPRVFDRIEVIPQAQPEAGEEATQSRATDRLVQLRGFIGGDDLDAVPVQPGSGECGHDLVNPVRLNSCNHFMQGIRGLVTGR